MRGFCKWIGDEEGNYETAYDEIFSIITDIPKENKMIYCPFCGGKICENEPLKDTEGE